MLSERQLESLMEVFNARMQKVVDLYLKQMGEHLRDIGQLTPSDVHKLTELKRMRANVNRIKREIARAARASIEDVEKVFRAVAASNEAFARQYYAAAQEAPVKGAAQRSQPMERILKAQLRITNQEMRNLSQTTIVSDAYRRAVDVAVQTVQGGLTSYNAAIRDAVKAAGVEGVLVRFPSGYSRRLDSAVRQNVLDGVRAVNNDTLRQLGKEFGADGIEISLHALCATDHLPYQGRRFTNRQFERLQNSLARPFGMWNCKHSMFPVLMSAPPLHTEEEIEECRRSSAEKIEIDGKTRSRYEWTQEQRRIEAAIRQQKDIANLARASGDMQEARKASARIGKLYERYDRISDAAGLDKQYSRGYVRGYREARAATAAVQAQRVSNEAPIAESVTTKQQPLQKQGEKRIIKANDAAIFFEKAAGGKAEAPVIAAKEETDATVASTKESGGGVNFICKLDRSIYFCVTEDITTDEVVISDERIAHIKERHPDDYEQYFAYIPRIIEEPDYILEDEIYTALILKDFKEDGKMFRLVLRLKTSVDDPNYKNAVLTFMRTSEKKWRQNIRNKKILYKREE